MLGVFAPAPGAVLEPATPCLANCLLGACLGAAGRSWLPCMQNMCQAIAVVVRKGELSKALTVGNTGGCVCPCARWASSSRALASLLPVRLPSFSILPQSSVTLQSHVDQSAFIHQKLTCLVRGQKCLTRPRSCLHLAAASRIPSRWSNSTPRSRVKWPSSDRRYYKGVIVCLAMRIRYS